MSNKYLISGIITVLLIGGFVYLVSANKTGTDETIESNQQSISQNEQAMKGEAIVEMIPPSSNPSTSSGSTTPPSGKIEEPKPVAPAPSNGSYKDYSSDAVASEQKAGNKVVLFFHAPWCPYCKAANTEFLNRTSEIPSGVTVLKTDYDSNSDLKKKYGITYQHTFVQIDNSGNMVTKWNGGDIEELKKYIK